MVHNDIGSFIALKPGIYKFLESFNFSRIISSEGCSKYNVIIVLSNLEGSQSLHIHFVNTFDTKINCVEGMHGLFFEISDITADQWEGGRYRVCELEENAFSFYCEDFYAEIKSKQE